MANHLLRLGMLAKLFFFSLWPARLLLFVGVPFALIGVIAKVTLAGGGWKAFFVVGSFTVAAVCVAIYIMIMFMMFPAHLMSLVSSRQYGLLPYIRHYLLGLIVCLLSLLQIVACCILVFGGKSDHALHFSLIVAIMSIISLVVMLSFVRLGSMQFLYFFVLPILGFYLVPQLNLISDLALSGILVCVWGVFLSWWFGWHPKKYHKSLFVMSAAELNKQNLFFLGGIYFRGAVPQNLESGILFGQFGNSFYQVRIFIMGILFTGSIFALLFMFSSRGLSEGLAISVRIGFGIQIIQIGYNYSLAVFKNFNKIWLYFPLERVKLFNAIERKVAVFYTKNLVVISAIILSMSFFVPGKYISLTNIALSVIASLLITPVSLYMAFIIYAKLRGNIKVFHWANGILMALLMGACFMGLEFIGYKGIANYIDYLLAIILISLGVILVVRQYAQRLWQQVDLVRVAI